MHLTFTRAGITSSLLIAGAFLFASIVIADITTGNSVTNVSNDVIYSEVTLNKPSGTSAGDFLLASISIDGGQPTTASTTPPSGWTLVAKTDNDTNIGIVTYWKVASSSEPSSYTWTVGTQVRAVGGITRFSGIDTSNPIDVVASSTGRGTSATAPSATTTSDGAKIIAVFAVQVGKNGTLFATSTGMTKLYDIKNNPLGPTASAQEKSQASAGASGAAESSFNTGTREWAAQTIALRKASLENGLVSYWKLDETSGNASDATGNGYTLTNNNSVSYATSTGKINSAANFVAASSQSQNRSDILGTSPGGSISISLWVKINSAPGTNSQYSLASVAAGGTSPYVSYIIYYRDTGGTKQVVFNRQRMSVANNDLTYNYDLGTGSYVHLVGTYDGTNSTLYINGSQVAQTAVSGNGADFGGANETIIGALHGSQGYYADASLDEVGVWSRALSATEVSNLYNGGSGLPFSSF